MPRFIVTTRIIETTTVEADTAEEACEIAIDRDADELTVMGRDARPVEDLAG